MRDELDHLLGETSGAIVLSGPAGSGKTTTIYACLRELAARTRGERSLATLEDPIEAVVPGVAQAQVNPAAGLTLESGLKSLLRQDPEVIAIGEIRDKTHGRDRASGRPHRPFDPDDLSRGQCLRGHRPVPRYGHRALRGPERAARRRRPAPGAPALRLCESHRAGPTISSACPCATPGCRAAATLCRGTGYLGRTVLAELLLPETEELARAVLALSDVRRLEQVAVAAGMIDRWERACVAVEQGLTSPAEVRRILGVAAFPDADAIATFVKIPA